MAKNMARIKDGVVVNMEWSADSAEDTDMLISVGDRPVSIGDTYDGVHFYHKGEKVLTPFEIQVEYDDMKAALNLLGVMTDG